MFPYISRPRIVARDCRATRIVTLKSSYSLSFAMMNTMMEILPLLWISSWRCFLVFLLRSYSMHLQKGRSQHSWLKLSILCCKCLYNLIVAWQTDTYWIPRWVFLSCKRLSIYLFIFIINFTGLSMLSILLKHSDSPLWLVTLSRAKWYALTLPWYLQCNHADGRFVLNKNSPNLYRILQTIPIQLLMV